LFEPFKLLNINASKIRVCGKLREEQRHIVLYYVLQQLVAMFSLQNETTTRWLLLGMLIRKNLKLLLEASAILKTLTTLSAQDVAKLWQSNVKQIDVTASSYPFNIFRSRGW
jgi:hypothetical protein